MKSLPLCVAWACFAVPISPLAAQQVQLTSPLVGVQESFFEQIGVGFSWRAGSHSFMNFGGPSAALPPFGGFRASSVARFGFGTFGSGGGAALSLSAAQGTRRTFTSSASSITLSDGATGTFQSGSLRPFVTGLVPVVGLRPTPLIVTSPLAERVSRLRYETTLPPPRATRRAPRRVARRDDPSTLWQARPRQTSTAERGDISLAEIRQQQLAADRQAAKQLQQLIDEAEQAVRAGRLGAARVRYRRAARQATGDLKRHLLKKLSALESET